MSRLLLVASLLCVVAAGCGSAEQEPNLAQAAQRTEAEGSSRIAMRAYLSEDKRSIVCDGSADYERRRLHFACADSYGEMIAIGDAVYVRSDQLGVATVRKWVKLPLDETDSIQSLSPQNLLGMLRAATVDTERIGEADVRGEPTVRYRLTVDCKEADIGCPGETAPVDVWIDDEGLVRRIELEDRGDPGTIEFFDFGVEVDIEPPPPDEIQEFGDGWTGYAPSPGGNAAQCSGKDARPISESRALESLRRNGLSVASDRSGPCVEWIAAELTNAPEDFDREGSVWCFLRVEPAPDAPKTVTRRGADGADAELALQNLECTIFTDSPTGEEKIDKLEAAFGDLERAIRP